MEKEQNQKSEFTSPNEESENKEEVLENSTPTPNNKNDEKVELIEKTAEEKILELEDKLTRTFAEMENQRRRFEKEKEEAYE